MHLTLYIVFVCKLTFTPSRWNVQNEFHFSEDSVLSNPVLSSGLFSPVLYRTLARCSFTDDESTSFLRLYPHFLTLVHLALPTDVRTTPRKWYTPKDPARSIYQ